MSVVGIDIDGTLARFAEWKGGEYVGDPDPAMVLVMGQLFRAGHTICIWTTRPDYVVERWLLEHRLRGMVHYINRSPYPTESGKASFDFYIGDDAVRWQDNADEVLDIVMHGKTGSSFERERDFSSHNPVPYLSGVGRAYVDMFEQAWQDAWKRHTQRGRIAFLTICSHAKPYSKSFIHTMIRRRLYEVGVLQNVDYAHISNAGIVPASAELDYPFNAYDWNGIHCSEEVRAYHMATIKRRFRYWLGMYAPLYERVVIYLRETGNTCHAVQEVLSGADYPKVTLVAAEHLEDLPFAAVPDVDDCLTQAINLNRLERAFK